MKSRLFLYLKPITKANAVVVHNDIAKLTKYVNYVKTYWNTDEKSCKIEIDYKCKTLGTLVNILVGIIKPFKSGKIEISDNYSIGKSYKLIMPAIKNDVLSDSEKYPYLTFTRWLKRHGLSNKNWWDKD